MVVLNYNPFLMRYDMKNKFPSSGSGVPKWLTLKNAIAISYYSFVFFSGIDRMLKGGDIPLPKDLQKEFEESGN